MPFVFSSPVRAPFLVNTAFVATVVPCTISSTRPRNSSSSKSWCPAISFKPFRSPIDGSRGVESTLYTSHVPDESISKKSVNVPPTSTPILNVSTKLAPLPRSPASLLVPELPCLFFVYAKCRRVNDNLVRSQRLLQAYQAELHFLGHSLGIAGPRWPVTTPAACFLVPHAALRYVADNLFGAVWADDDLFSVRVNQLGSVWSSRTTAKYPYRRRILVHPIAIERENRAFASELENGLHAPTASPLACTSRIGQEFQLVNLVRGIDLEQLRVL